MLFGCRRRRSSRRRRRGRKVSATIGDGDLRGSWPGMYFGTTSTASVALRPRRTSAVSPPIVSFKPLVVVGRVDDHRFAIVDVDGGLVRAGRAGPNVIMVPPTSFKCRPEASVSFGKNAGSASSLSPGWSVARGVMRNQAPACGSNRSSTFLPSR